MNDYDEIERRVFMRLYELIQEARPTVQQADGTIIGYAPELGRLGALLRAEATRPLEPIVTVGSQEEK